MESERLTLSQLFAGKFEKQTVINMDERQQAVILTAITLSDDFLRCHVFFDTDSETSDDSDLDEGEMRRRIQLRGGQRKPPRIKNYVEIAVPRLNTQQFKRHFRMTPTTYENLEARLGPVLSLSQGKAVVPVRKQLLGSLWLLATPDSYRYVSDKHLLLYKQEMII